MAISGMLRDWICLITGTKRPVGVSIAMPMLWEGRWWIAGVVEDRESVAFRMGCLCRERETALIM